MSEPVKRHGLWPKTDKNGGRYLNGSVEIDGQTYWVNIYPNKFKEEGDNKPSHHLMLQPKEVRQVSREQPEGFDPF